MDVGGRPDATIHRGWGYSGPCRGLAPKILGPDRENRRVGA